MIGIFLFVLGAVIGSFLNVVALRFNTGITLQGHSGCPVCQKRLGWWELIPIVSFFLLRGRCSQCKTRISWQYSLVEILTGLIFLSIYNLQFTFLQSLFVVIIFCIYIVILIYDLRHKIIPDALVYSAIFLSMVGRWLFASSTLDWLAGPILFVFFGLIWLLSRGRAMGFGDAKLALSIGLLLGAAEGFSAIVLAFWIGAIISLSMITSLRFRRNAKRLTMKSEIPFAPFLIIGAWISLIFHLDFLHVLTL